MTGQKTILEEVTVSEGERSQALTQGPYRDLKGPKKRGVDLSRKRLEIGLSGKEEKKKKQGGLEW